MKLNVADTYRRSIIRARACVRTFSGLDFTTGLISVFVVLLFAATLFSASNPSTQISSDNEFDRAKGVVALGLARDANAVPELTALYAGETSKMVKLYTLQALFDIAWEGKTDFLEGALSDSNADIRLKAAQLLGKFEWQGNNTALANMLDDSDLRVQVAAATALGGAAGQTALLRLNNSANLTIKSQALLGLSAIHASGPAVVAAVNAARNHADPQVRAAADWAAQTVLTEVNP